MVRAASGAGLTAAVARRRSRSGRAGVAGQQANDLDPAVGFPEDALDDLGVPYRVMVLGGKRRQALRPSRSVAGNLIADG